MKSSKLPIQAAPVERNITGAAISNQNGVDPSFDWGGLAAQLIPIAAGALGSVI